MTYIISAWYVEQEDGTLTPCQNYKTAEYLVTNTNAVRVVDITREAMSK